MVQGNPNDVSLEPAAQAFVDGSANPPQIYDLGPEAGRKALDAVQSSEVPKPEIDEEWITVTGTTGDVRVRIVKPRGAGTETLPVIVYTHGAGWVFGDANTHDRLVRDLATGVRAAVVFPEYTRSPEAQYPVALEQSYAAAKWVATDGDAHGLDASRMAVAGDSVGGNMAAALTILAKERNEFTFVQQVLFYPVTDANFETNSYKEFAVGYFLTLEGMKYYWDQYAPSADDRKLPTVAPLQASLEELAGLPPALIITGEADVLRDEGEAYASKLRRAGVLVTNARYGGIVHDFVMVNPLFGTEAQKAAVRQAIDMLSRAFDS